ncbi:MAG: Dabb family protein [Ginsengibacter sp.]
MKKVLLTLSIFIVILLLFINNGVAQTNNSSTFLRHMVIITFKSDASEDNIKSLDSIYTYLSKSPMVKDFELGVNISPRDSGDIKHVYVTSFSSKEDMKNYTKIPEYKSLFKISMNIAEDVSVVDYWITK